MLRRLFMVFFAANCLFAQSAPAPRPTLASASSIRPPAEDPSDAQNKISINSDLVVLPVTVKNQLGDLVPDLQESEFHIFDDEVEQSIDVFTEEAFPLSLVVLIDDDLKSKETAQIAPTLRAITAGISANDEVIVCRFDLEFYPGEQFTGDLDKIWADLVRIEDRSRKSKGKSEQRSAALNQASDRALGVG